MPIVLTNGYNTETMFENPILLRKYGKITHITKLNFSFMPSDFTLVPAT